jgi:hypothetical protein
VTQLRLAGISRVLGEHEEAAQAAREGIAIFRELVAEEPGELSRQRDLAALSTPSA